MARARPGAAGLLPGTAWRPRVHAQPLRYLAAWRFESRAQKSGISHLRWAPGT